MTILWDNSFYRKKTCIFAVVKTFVEQE